MATAAINEGVSGNAAGPFYPHIDRWRQLIWFDCDGSNHPRNWNEWCARSAKRKKE
jgi:hypothetical protein